MIDDGYIKRGFVAKQIIRKRGGIPTSEKESNVVNEAGENARDYSATHIPDGLPQMGFSLFCSNGKRHAFLYHNIDNLDLTEGKYGHYITLSHRGKVVTMRGQNMHGIIHAIMDHTLQALYQFDPEAYPEPTEDEPIINFIRVQTIHRLPQPSDDDEVSGEEPKAS